MYLTDNGCEISSELREIKNKLGEIVFDGFSKEKKKQWEVYWIEYLKI